METIINDPAAIELFNSMVAQRRFIYRSRNAQVKAVLRKRVKVLIEPLQANTPIIGHDKLCRTCGVTGMIDNSGACSNCNTSNN